MPGTIDDFRASFRTDFARPARFDVFIPVPIKLAQQFGFVARNLLFRCEQSELPGRSFGTLDRKTYGPPEKQPYLTNYSEVTCSFIVSDDMSEKLFFDSWLELIQPKETFNFAYKTEYAVGMQINQYSVDNQLSYSVLLREAFPISINQLDLDWSNENSHHKLMVVFAYYTWDSLSPDGVLTTQRIETVPARTGQPNIYSMQVIGTGMNLPAGFFDN